jgi:hypothetical protein
MSDPIQLSGPQIGEFRNALLDAFPMPNQLPQVVQVGTGEAFYSIVSQWENQKSQAFNLIIYFNSRGRIEELLDAALSDNPGNRGLRRFAEGLGQAPPAAARGGPEAIVLPHVPPADVEAWRARMAACERTVCRIEIPAGRGIGTGFLLGPVAVITNHHVLEQVWERANRPEEVAVRFDYKRTASGDERPGRAYALDLSSGGDEPWVLARSPQGELDYVVLKIKGAPGHEAAGPAKNSPKRGWVTLDRHPARPDDPLMILQHPAAQPMQYAVGSVTAVEDQSHRLVHNAGTKPGSSGSPCFSGNWAVVALHHYGDAQRGNRSVLFPAILDHLGDRGDIFGD